MNDWIDFGDLRVRRSAVVAVRQTRGQLGVWVLNHEFYVSFDTEDAARRAMNHITSEEGKQ